MNNGLQSVLVSNHKNWEIGYKNNAFRKDSRLSIVAKLIGYTIAWPIFFLIGTLFLSYYLFKYFKTVWKQYKLINIISNPKLADKYFQIRNQWCEDQINDLKLKAIHLMNRHIEKPDKIGFTIPEKKHFIDYADHRFSDNCWKDFKWTEFSNTDFFDKSKSAVAMKGVLTMLGETATKMKFLTNQKKALVNSKGRLSTVKKIAEMSFVKNAFIRQDAKEWILHSILWLLPSGAFWDFHYNPSPQKRLIFEGNKNFLPAGTNLQKYDDLIDAHNKLVKEGFLVPYIEKEIE